MAANTTTQLERVRYWQGQLLGSGDLQTQLGTDEELRRLHNREVHNAYGIAIGLAREKDLEKNKNEKGLELLDERTLNLPCGMAYDCAGRALIVEEDRPVRLPTPVTDRITLVLSFDSRSADGILLTWRPEQDVSAKSGVAITRLLLDKGAVKLDPEFRPVIARPIARPRLATGTTIPGETAWKPWKVEEPDGGETEFGVQVTVDTSSAGFTRIPHYFAESIAGSPTDDFVPAWFANVTGQSTQGFMLQLMLRRITRKSLELADPKVQVAATPTLDSLGVTLETGGLLVGGDLVARLLPLAEQGSVITQLSGATATLDFPLEAFDATKQAAFGNLPRIAEKISAVSDTPSFEVTVENPAHFKEDDVVFKLDDESKTARPARITAIDDDDVLEIFPPIAGLKETDKLAVADQKSTVKSVSKDGLSVAVESVAGFAENGFVVRLVDPIENAAPAKIRHIDAETNILVLFETIPNLGSTEPLGFAIAGDTVKTITDLPDEPRVTVGATPVKKFRKGDIVAKRSDDGSFSTPVRVKDTKKKGLLDLSGPIPGLKAQDTIVAADFRVRATVLAVSIDKPSGLPIVTVAESKLFAQAGFVALINDSLEASNPVAIKDIRSASEILLAGKIDGLAAGQVIGLCAFPSEIQVLNVEKDGTIVVKNGKPLQEADVVMATPAASSHTEFAVVAGVKGDVVTLTRAIPDLAADDKLSVANIRGVVDVTPTASNSSKVKVESDRVRLGDFLADIKGWCQPESANSTAPFIRAVNGGQITLSARLDGLLKNDTIGLASLTLPALQIRLKEMDDLTFGDEIRVVGFDRLKGAPRSIVASVAGILKSSNLVVLIPEGPPPPFTFRPEDISASMLFVRGSALDVIKKNDLYVRWLAIGEPDPAPKPCADTDAPDCACKAKE